MLKLEKLEVSGFKSFVDPVSLEFAGGLTSIVGPNGCGKSNVADAVVWVLGERSAKSLRGNKMEDVIFAGSANRKPIGMAEVMLTLSTDATMEQAIDGRITIGRRLYRSGESQYLLNGKRSKLKEIKDFLMDTGLGIRTYSMIEQGKIGQILSSKPQERRKLLEEAAGITRYRERRRIAEIKLEESKGNLARLDDIVSEIERTLRSLKRQAGAARRYKERQDRHEEILREVLLGRWSRVGVELQTTQKTIGEQIALEAELSASLAQAESALAEGREHTDELARLLAERHREEAELAATIEGRQEFIKGSRQRRQEVQERLAGGRAAAAARKARRGELQQAVGGRRTDRSEIVNQCEQAASEVHEDEEKIALFDTTVEEAESRVESVRARLLASMAELNGMRNRLHREQTESEKGDFRRKHLDEMRARNAEELNRTQEQLRAASEGVQELQSIVETRDRELNESRDVVQGMREKVAQTEAQQTELGAKWTELKQRREILTSLGEAQAERRARITDRLREAGLEEISFLSDRIEVPQGWQNTLDLYLNELADAVLLPDDAAGLEIARSLSGGRGTSRLVQTGGVRTDRHAEARADSAVEGSLAETLQLPSELADALPPAFLVRSAADATRLAAAHPGVAFLSRDRLWAQGGLLHVQGEAAEPGVLAREQELTEVHKALPPMEQELEQLRLEIEELTESIHAKAREIALVETELAEKRRELAVATARRDDIAARERRLAVESETVETEHAEVSRHLSLIGDRAEKLITQLARAEAIHEELEKGFDGAQTDSERSRRDREALRTSGASRRGRLDLLRERLSGHDSEIARIERELGEIDHSVEEWTTESKQLEERGAQIVEGVERAETELQSALEKREGSQEAVLEQQTALNEQRKKLEGFETRVTELREERDQLRIQLNEGKVRQATVQQDSEHLLTSFREHFGEEPPEVVPEPPSNLAELEVDLTRLKDQLERMGPVNLLAAEEYAEQEERHGFLTVQRTDIADSVKSLSATIREINETSGERFRLTFEEVNESFRKTYSELFRGGEAEMRLLDDEDILESGIEIVARPPGKRLQNIMLLSGGEKALTAIALLFALFRTKPSPFCILDEVDAPLDDINTLRFVEIVKKMAKDTQFIVITHNKLTMEAASLLYGVTMQERGVSNLVSVELDEVQPVEEAEPELATA